MKSVNASREPAAFFPGGCAPDLRDPGSRASAAGAFERSAALIDSLGGLASAAMSGKLGSAIKSMLKSKGIDLAKQAATGLLMKLFTIPPTSRPPRPPWTGLGKVAAAGSAVASSAMEAYDAAHKGPVISSGSCPSGGSSGGGNGAARSAAAGSSRQLQGRGSAGSHDPRGAPASRAEWEKFLGLPGGFLPDHDPQHPEAFDYLDTLPLEAPWYASILGGNMDDGYTALFGLIELGSPKWPGAGTHDTWWVPDRIFGRDMSAYYSLHDERFDSSRDLSDVGDILGTELVAFLTGLSHAQDPVHVGLQSVYSSATLIAGLYYGVANTLWPTSDEEQAYEALQEHLGKSNSPRGPST